MTRIKRGDVVVDERVHELAEVVAVHRVPPTADLFGGHVDGHMRYTLRFSDGRAANDRRRHHIRPVATPGA